MQNPKKVTLQRPGKLYTSIYHSGSINHSGTAKKLDSQAQITCCPYGREAIICNYPIFSIYIFK